MNHDNVDPVVLGNDAATDKVNEEHPTVVRSSSNNTQGERSLGKKSVLRLCANDKLRQKAMENRESIADSLRRRAELLKEKNAMMAFKIEKYTIQDDFDERTKCFRFIQKAHLKRIHERLGEEEYGSVSKRLVSAVVSIAQTEDEALGDSISEEYIMISEEVNTGRVSPEADTGGTSIESDVGVGHTRITSQ